MSTSSANCEEVVTPSSSDTCEAPESSSALNANKIAETEFWETAKASLAAFTSRLGGGGFGDLRLEGSKPTHAKYHKEAWDIVEALQEAIKIKEREYRLAELAEQKKAEELQPPSKTTAKMSANNTKVMEGVIDRHLEDTFRDINIKMGEMATRLEKAEKRNAQLETKLGKFMAKSKKSSTQDRKLEEEFSKLHSDINDAVCDIYDLKIEGGLHDDKVKVHSQRLDNLESQNTSLQDKLQAAESKIKKLEKGAKASTDDLKQKIASPRAWVWSDNDFED
ncbi:hypothetical protein HII31_06283 [Pseudocercospora fuligena]|uniref:Uncharacterized protein n=1 Tax=Pseudocercospora fuligena TaxID=685502 RepID=A0A8H6RJM0_9PEZI|nr:hypothetical protein HII31_06283 [Pseudocercospora fuligena]